MSQPTRRTLLCSIAGVAALSGCSKNTESPSDSGQFKRASVEDQQLVITMSESLDAETVSVVDSNGEAFAETDLNAGVTRVTFDIGTGYVPGEYRILATDGEETIAETTTVIKPDLQIVDIGVGANHQDRMPEELGNTRDVECFVKVENRGQGPEIIEQLHIKGEVPNPTNLAESESGIFDAEDGGGEKDRVLLLRTQQRDIFSSSLPFSFEGSGTDCETEPQRGLAKVSISTRVGSDLEREYEITYSASSEYDGCNIAFETGG
jgi:hypothetical protein